MSTPQNDRTRRSTAPSSAFMGMSLSPFASASSAQMGQSVEDAALVLKHHVGEFELFGNLEAMTDDGLALLTEGLQALGLSV